MIEVTPARIAEVTGGRLHHGPGTPVTRVHTDSRTVDGPGVFVALRTPHGDGHDHVAEAVRRGATAAVVERRTPEAVPQVVVADTWQALQALAVANRLAVGPTAVAVTGSVGKTTVKDLAAAAVGAGRRVHAARGSYNNELGVPLTLLGMGADTEVVVAEIGARHPGDIADLAPMVAPDVAVVTAVAEAHLEAFGSIEVITAAKRELVESLGPNGVAVLNVADHRVASMAAAAPRVIGVAPDDPAADVHARDVRLDAAARATATAVTPWGRAEVRLSIAGRHHLGNALLAIAVAGHLGVDVVDAAAAISAATVSPWRSQLRSFDGVHVLDDAYNANPASVIAALDTLEGIDTDGRRIAVLGEMAEIGPSSAAAHTTVGRHCAAAGVDVLVAVGAAGEDLAAAASDAGVADVRRVPDADAAGAAVAALVRRGDTVLVKASRVVGLEAVTEALARGGTDPGAETAPADGETPR